MTMMMMMNRISLLLALATSGMAMSHEHYEALKTAAWVSATAMNEGKYALSEREVGPVNDEIRFGTWKGQKVLFFDGTDHILEWFDNVGCGLGGCDWKTLVSDVYNVIPEDFRTSNDVICFGWSRGNFFVAGFAWMYPDVCKYVVAIGSPGMMADPRHAAVTLTIDGIFDSVSHLGLPQENQHHREVLFSIHCEDSYKWAIGRWVGDHIKHADDATTAHRLSKWGH